MGFMAHHIIAAPWILWVIFICGLFGQEPHASSEFPPEVNEACFFAGSISSIPIFLGFVLNKLPHLTKKSLE